MIHQLNKEAMKLHNQTAVVTGGASGIGRAISTLFAEEGARVLILDYHLEQAQAVAGELNERGLQADAFECDVSDTRQVESCFSGLPAPIDILVNNAGVSHIGTLEQTSEEDFDRVYRVNVKGIFNCSRAVITQMKERKKGVILNMASVASHIGIPDRFAYSMSKGAVLTMTWSIASDYVDHNIRCNCIAPARVHTPFVDDYLAKNYPGREKEMYDTLSRTQPVGRMGTPEEVARVALFLCSEDASFLTGTSYPVDGGFLSIKR